MKKWLKFLLWLFWLWVILSLWLIWYVFYEKSKCPKWYDYNKNLEKCSDCELTLRQIKNWEIVEYNDECLNIKKTCYMCEEHFDISCDCLADIIWVKVD